MEFNIRERTRKFAVRVIKLVKKFPSDVAGQELGRQLIRSGTSIGANLEEADAASSRKDFFYKVTISYKEARESEYWLGIIAEAKVLNNQSNVQEANALQSEAIELSKILYSIINPKKRIKNDE